MKDLLFQFSDLSMINKPKTWDTDWFNQKKPTPTKVALWVIKNELRICTLYWEWDNTGAWGDENAISACSIILDLK